MGLLPEIEGGVIKEETQKLYTSRRITSKKFAAEEEERLAELNNYRRKEVSKDFSDSPHI
jgi:hypothetical protein